MNRVVTIVGPTAIGKSEMAVYLAKQFDGEIVSADSRQVYQYMDIGTAKPSREERARVPHYLIDTLKPEDDFSLAQYQQLAYRHLQDIQERGKLPIIAGGSGLYVWAVLEGWGIPEVPPDNAFRQELEARAAGGEIDELHDELRSVDPDSARAIDPRNVRRVIRALEATKHAGAPFSQLQKKTPPPFETLIIGLTTERDELYRRIDERVDRMIEQGLVEETQRLVRMGYTFNQPAMSGIGYKEIGMYLRGEISLETAIQQIKYETHRLVRVQYNWFKPDDKRIHWFDIKTRPAGEIVKLVTRFVQGLSLS